MSRTITKTESQSISRPKSQASRTREIRLIGEWQRGWETMSGYAQRKLRLALSPTQSRVTARAAG